jgi:hypothetical protein
MTTERDPQVYCGDCGAVVKPDLPDKTRLPCPACGSTRQEVRITIADTISLHDEVRLVARHSEAAPHYKMRTGDSWSTKFSKWMHRTRRIDREGDLYEETVTDPDTGEVIHQQSERLTDHLGHGSDRTRRK